MDFSNDLFGLKKKLPIIGSLTLKLKATTQQLF